MRLRAALVGWLPLLLVGVLGASCSPPAPTPTRAARNAVVVILDAAGWKYFGVYGNPLPTTPHIDAFARGSTVFTRAYAQSPWTLASASSFLTGRYPRPDLGHERIDTREGIAAQLQRAGFRTGAFSESPYVTRTFGFGLGFETFEEGFPFARLRRDPRTYGRVRSERTIRRALEWIDAGDGRPFFLYVHLLPPHSPYVAPKPFRGRFDADYEGQVEGRTDVLLSISEGERAIDERDLDHLRRQYQENLAYGDRQVGRLLRALGRRGLLADTLVVIASDHGEAFLEHGELLHNTSVYDEMVRVPLIVRFPGEGSALPSRVETPVEMRSLPATICDVLAVADCRISGESLLRPAADEGAGVAVSYATTAQGRPLVGVVRGDYKLIVDSDTSETIGLFDLRLDPAEKKPLSDRPDVEQAGRAALPGAADVIETQSVEVDAEMRARLKALGYHVE